MGKIFDKLFENIDGVRETIRIKAQEQTNKIKDKIGFARDKEIQELEMLKKEYEGLLDDPRYLSFIELVAKLDLRLTNDLKAICRTSKSIEKRNVQILKITGAQILLDMFKSNNTSMEDFIEKIKKDK